MRVLARQALFGLALAGLAAPALADNFKDAQRWLERMSQAMGSMSYQGTFVYMRGQDVETMRITHVSDERGLRERMVALSGPHREIIRDENGVQCVLGEEGEFTTDPAMAQSLFPELPIDELGKARDRYLWEVGDLARIAGFKGRRISILPRDEFRYGYDFWLEQDSGLLLRWVMYDATRRPLAKLMFTDLVVGSAIDVSELETDTPPEAFVRLGAGSSRQEEVSAVESQWKPTTLPPGFQVAALSRGATADAGRYEHLVLSDGLVSVSVYIEDSEAARKLGEGLSRMGTTNAFSRRAGNRQVTAIGDVPAATVRAISKAFARPVAAAEGG